jgi:hypothetical protein
VNDYTVRTDRENECPSKNVWVNASESHLDYGFGRFERSVAVARPLLPLGLVGTAKENLPLGLVGSVIGGWMGSGDRMSLYYYSHRPHRQHGRAWGEMR